MKKAAKSLKDIGVNVAAIDCDQNKQLASQYGIKGFPTIKIFAQNKNQPQDYSGQRNARGIYDHFAGLIPSSVVTLTSKNINTFLDTADTNKVILFSSKTATPPLFRSLGHYFTQKGLNFGMITSSQKELTERFSVTSFPKIMIFENSQSEPTVYGDKSEYEALLRFFKPFAKKLSSSSSTKPQPQSQSPPEDQHQKPPIIQMPRRNEALEFIEVTSQDTFQSACTAAKKICAVFLLNKGTVDLEKLKLFLDKYKNDPINFVSLDKNKYLGNLKSTLTELEGVASAEHLVLIINPKRMKYAVQEYVVGEEKNVALFLDRLIGGDLKLNSFDKLPTLE